MSPQKDEGRYDNVVQRSLSKFGPDTLWVVDNVQTIDLVNELSSGIGSISLLVTTQDARDYLLSPTVAYRDIDVLDSDPAIALLCSRRSPESSWELQDPSLGEIVANSLAIGYRALGRYQDAARLNEETLSIGERLHGPEHPSILQSRSNLANDYSALGRYQDAVRINEEILSIKERVLGPEDPDTLQSRNNLANVCHALGGTIRRRSSFGKRPCA